MTEIILRKHGASLVPVDDAGRDLLAKLKDNRDVDLQHCPAPQPASPPFVFRDRQVCANACG